MTFIVNDPRSLRNLIDIEGSLRCSSCGSADTILYRNPKTTETDGDDSLRLAQCRECGEIFGLDQTGSMVMPIAADIGTPIDVSTACYKCGSDLQTQKIGGVCPECGSAISRFVMSIQTRANEPLSLVTKVGLIFYLVLIVVGFGLYAIGNLNPGFPAEACLGLLIGLGAGSFGMVIFIEGKYRIFLTTVTGWRAKLYGLFFFAVGIGFFILGVGLFAGWW